MKIKSVLLLPILFIFLGITIAEATTYTTEQYILEGKLHRVIVTSTDTNKITASYIKDDNLGKCLVKYSSENEITSDTNYIIVDCGNMKSIFTENGK